MKEAKELDLGGQEGRLCCREAGFLPQCWGGDAACEAERGQCVTEVQEDRLPAAPSGAGGCPVRFCSAAWGSGRRLLCPDSSGEV